MKKYIRQAEEARRLAAKVSAQQSVPERVTALLGTPSTWDNNNGTNYEWTIPEITVDKISADLRRKLESLGCTMFNVDSSREPYYFVCVRYIEPTT